MITKRLSPKGRSVRVYFEMNPNEAPDGADVVGSFNDWTPGTHPMKFREKDGVLRCAESFKPGERIEFRYRLPDGRYVNDPEADGFTANGFGESNSVLVL